MTRQDRYLKHLCEEGAKELGIDISSGEYNERLQYELGVIEQGGLANYFLIVEDIITWARNNSILVGPGRGSSAGSLVCYLVGITMIDPLEHGLLFERFLNPVRAAMGQLPDIDIDFPKSKRQNVIKYIKDKYGEDCVANIPTIARYGVKRALRDLARIESIPIPEVDAVAKSLPDGISIDDAMALPNVKIFLAKHPRVERLLPQLVGSVRHRGVHPAGVIITPKPISEYLALERVTQTNCVCFDKDLVEELGFVKIDILGLNTLDVVQKTIDIIKETTGEEVILPRKFDERAVYMEIFDKGRTLGIFQFETSTLTEFAKKMGIDKFEILSDTTSLIRPGPLHSGQADKYMERKHGKKDVTYIPKEVKPILESTQGIIIYQEQIMHIVNQLGSLSLADAENIRKLISKSKGLDALDEYADQFIDGCIANGINKEEAIKLWSIMRESGEYSFNKSHAVAYSALSYWCAWLKKHYPKQFLVALMDFEEDEVLSQAVVELREMGYTVRNPHINDSSADTKIDSNGDVIFGLGDVKKVGPAAVNDILSKQPFSTFDEFFNKREARKTNVGTIRNLIKAGAFDDFGRRDRLYYKITPDEEEHTWDEKEMSLMQLDVLEMPPKVPVINYYRNPFRKTVTTIRGINIDWEDVREEIYVRGIITSIKMKTGYALVNINDGTATITILLGEEQVNHYQPILDRGVGTPIMVKAHMVEARTRLYSDMIIPLEDYDEFKMEINYFETGREEMLEAIEQTSHNKVGLVISSNYFTSKKGNKGTRLVFSNGDRYMNFDRNIGKPIMAGEILEYKVSGGAFINVLNRW